MSAALASSTAARPPAARPADAGFGLYVHWPFCRAKCPYCDFNSHVRDSVDQARWRRALLAELEHAAAHETVPPAAAPRRLTSLFFGGGTPSLMDPETVAALIARARRLWPCAADLEVTLEANPTSVEAGRFAELAASGVTRVSLGVQALDDAALAFLGRRHSAAEARAALAVARRHFARWSFDLIYARPGQTAAAWRAELDAALGEGATHLSLYQLTIEPDTAFHGAWRRGELVPAPEETAAALYDLTQERLAAAGLPAYEISNHARPGQECRHNLTYWRYGDYLGIGPGAHGRLTLADGSDGTVKLALRRHRAPEAWLDAVERAGHATRARERLSPAARLAELVMMGLRLDEGVSRAAFRRETGAMPEEVLDMGRLRPFLAGGLLRLDEAGLRASEAGRQRLDGLLARIL
jgi:oxygen-independent coproporphyrinogen-3 oxidase